MKNIIKSVIVVLLSVASYAQQDAMVSQYMFNGLYINPAYAGSHDYWTSSLTSRHQWVSFEGAPRTFIAGVDGPIAAKNMGLGFVFMNDQIGVSTQNALVANYAYQLKIKEGHILALGASAGGSQFSARLTDLTVWDEGDEVFMNNLTSKFIPRFGFGMYYHSENAFAGFSIPTLLGYEGGKDFNMDVSKATFLHRHYLLTGGYIFDIAENVKLKPSTLIKYVPSAPLQVDLNVGALFQETFWFGTSFRSGDAVVLMAEYQSNAFFRIGYAYDITFSEIRKYSHGSHEILIGIDFGKDLVTKKTPRYF
jgi:type IX secretion system PorP/SprF family membrane protein